MKFCDKEIQEHLLKGYTVRYKRPMLGTYANVRMVEGQLKYFPAPTFTASYIVDNYTLTDDSWEIVEDDFDWDKIIEDKILCVFSDYKDFRSARISNVSKVSSDLFYTREGKNYNYCKPFVPSEYNIVKNLADYQKTS